MEKNEIIKAAKDIQISLDTLIKELENDRKTPIEKWFANLSKEPSVRLCNLLLCYIWSDSGQPFKYIEDVNKVDFMSLRNAGKRSWTEFCDLRE